MPSPNQISLADPPLTSPLLRSPVMRSHAHAAVVDSALIEATILGKLEIGGPAAITEAVAGRLYP